MGAINRRIEDLRAKLDKENIDTFMVLIGENRRYLSGFTAEDSQFDESSGALFISRDALVLATDPRFEIQAKKECPDFELVIYKKGLAAEMPGILKPLGTKRLGFESRRMSHDGYLRMAKEFEKAGLSVELLPCTEMVESLRIIKDEEEIKALKDAVFLAESAFRQFIPCVREGAREAEAAWELEKRMREAGAEGLSFPIIAASGPNSALPHAVPEDRAFNTGEPLLFDWGARLNGYCSDMTRTFFLEKPDPEFEKIFRTVHEAQQKAVEAIKPGRTTFEIDKAARSHIEDCGFKGFFGHGLGHGVGLAVHEQPSLSPVREREKTIEENMVFTVEPGIYIPDKGGVRLENMVVVRGGAAEVLNQLEISMQMV